eukprot:TRINITY_DN304_c0_g1_i1.p1 TRINITY_DN304_c0_g1~~TRINITY_DN304_c0_g1_i1.p1  ORF type:complete len:493 (+),score=148.34 TRINITY_DN304_c0_g1_i1:636-2114(+)
MCTIAKNVYLFGGNAGDAVFNDLYVLDTESMRWSQVTFAADAVLPPARAGHSATMIGGKMYIFGGGLGQSVFNDLWIYDPDTQQWQCPTVSGTAPTPRAGHSAVCVGETNLLVFGGGDISHVDNQLFVFDTEMLEWRQPTVRGIAPQPRAGHSAVCSGNYVFILGGGDMRSIFRDLTVLDTQEDPTFLPGPASTLETKLRMRPLKADLVARHILRADHVSPSVYQLQQRIQRSQISNRLAHFFQKRPSLDQLVEQRVLPAGTNISPHVQAAHKSIRKNALERLLVKRPEAAELIQRHILQEEDSHTPTPASQDVSELDSLLTERSTAVREQLNKLQSVAQQAVTSPSTTSADAAAAVTASIVDAQMVSPPRKAPHAPPPLSPFGAQLLELVAQTDTIVTTLMDDLKQDLTRRELARQQELDDLRRLLLDQQVKREQEVAALTQLVRSRELRVATEMDLLQSKLMSFIMQHEQAVTSSTATTAIPRQDSPQQD